tara:strand:+ start:165 stop:1295 length:1131 start_codon:yes stop_codon:yes gene_type:complete
MKIFIVNPGMVNDYVYELATSMHKNGNIVYVYGSDDYEERSKNFFNFNYYNYFFKVENIKIQSIKRLIKGTLYIFLQFYLLKEVIKEKPKVIHFQWSRIPLLDQFFLIFFKRYSSVVFTLHNTTNNHGDKSFLISLLSIGYRQLLKEYECIIVHTNYSKKKLLSDYPDLSSKVQVIPHGMLRFPKKIKNELNLSFSSKYVLLFFGNIQYYKGLDILIEAMYLLKDLDITLLIAGKSNIPLEPLKQRANDLSIEKKIHWHTFFIKDRNVEEIYDYCDFVILPHRHIDQSGILMSAIQFGKPVVASDTGGFSEIIEDGKQGFLFKKEDPADLSRAIRKIVDTNKLLELDNNMSLLRDSWKTWHQIAFTTMNIYKTLKD